MMIRLKEIIDNTEGLIFKDVLHIGAHDCQEYEEYKEQNCKKIVWVEANPIVYNRNFLKFKDKPDCFVLNCLAAENSNEFFWLGIANNEQSSSILPLGTHKKLFPSIDYVQKIPMLSTKVDDILNKYYLNDLDINFLNLDIQGAELIALKGASKLLSNQIDVVYTEINEEEVYVGCALIGEIDNYLEDFGFKRLIKKNWRDHPWGDAVYVKDKFIK